MDVPRSKLKTVLTGRLPMNSRPQFISLTPDLARALIEEMQAVLDGEASYFHAELWTDSGLQVGVHLSGPEDVVEEGGPYHE